MEMLIEELERLIERRAKDLIKQDIRYKDKYEDLEQMLLELITGARELKEDMDKHELHHSAIEAEGFLRFGISVEQLLGWDK